VIRQIYLCAALTVISGASSCAKHNPASCCSTAAQCVTLGLDGLYSCQTGLVCDESGTCVTPSCISNSECMDPTPICGAYGTCMPACNNNSDCASPTPVCSQGECVPACNTNSDCGGTTPLCNEGGCVPACNANSDCSGQTPVCTGGKCVSCTHNEDCPSNACLPNGSCASAGDVAFVNENGSGATCTFQSPCALISTALTLGTPVIRINGRIRENGLSFGSGSRYHFGLRVSTGTITS